MSSQMVTIGFKNTKKVLADFSKFETNLTQTQVKKLNKTIPAAFFKFEKELFASEGKKGDHKKWAALNKDYAKRKAKQFPGKTILRRKDRLYKSLTSGTEDTIQFIGNVSGVLIVRLGTQVPYAQYHQEGTPVMPIRRSIDPSEKLLVAWMKLIHLAYVNAAKKGPFEPGLYIKPGYWDKKDV